jgi:hypothetical protein
MSPGSSDTGHAAATRAGQWLARGIDAHIGDPLAGSSGQVFRKLKALCEIAFLTAYTGRSDPLVDSAVRRALAKLGPSSRFPKVFFNNLGHANLFVPLAIGVMFAHARSDPTGDDLDGLVTLAGRRTKELAPFRRADLSHALYVWTGDERRYADCVHAAEQGCLGRTADDATFDPADDYAATHTIFYATDFGRRPWPSVLAPIGTVNGILSQIAAESRATRNMDLLAEVVLCHRFLGQPDGQGTLLPDVADAQTIDGSWEGPADMGRQLAREGIEQQSFTFWERYHTTLLCLNVVASQNVLTPPGPLNREAVKSSRRADLAKSRRISGGATQLLDWLCACVDGDHAQALVVPDHCWTSAHWVTLAVECVFWARELGCASPRDVEYAKILGASEELANDPAWSRTCLAVLASQAAGDLSRSSLLFDRLWARVIEGNISSCGRTAEIPSDVVDRVVVGCIMVRSLSFQDPRRTLIFERSRELVDVAWVRGDRLSATRLMAFCALLCQPAASEIEVWRNRLSASWLPPLMPTERARGDGGWREEADGLVVDDTGHLGGTELVRDVIATASHMQAELSLKLAPRGLHRSADELSDAAR